MLLYRYHCARTPRRHHPDAYRLYMPYLQRQGFIGRGVPAYTVCAMLGVQYIPDFYLPRTCIHFSRLCLYHRRRHSCRLGTAPLLVSSARLLELNADPHGRRGHTVSHSYFVLGFIFFMGFSCHGFQFTIILHGLSHISSLRSRIVHALLSRLGFFLFCLFAAQHAQ
ncbi:hypothetical protein F5J12DRAFT_399894 [Pisolithus orientalis]|uniref:uncharacterized protein n=1 Tax=Pisolithus orientalis TaxID=936130 RepID=UPI0022241C2B|nr:uncharacterized protein F5J12DRAFT_399894 [Pisolithus orientalis]KAI6028880.1 hypothetical protein F5J12DRAFT_399894 [Pisolithus orientalis]